MDHTYIEWVLDSVLGNLTEDVCCPQVENLFAEGQPCMELYKQCIEAYWRLCDRLGVDEDNDGEIIINSLLKITRLVGMEMFSCGAKLC